MNHLLKYAEQYHMYNRGLNIQLFKHPCRVYKFWLNATDAVWQWQLPHTINFTYT